MVIVVALAGTVTRSMLAGLRQIRDHMQDIAKGGGDLSARLKISSEDEIGQTAMAFNRFLEQLGGMFSGLRDEALGRDQRHHPRDQGNRRPDQPLASTPRSKRRVPASRGAASPSWPTKCASSPSARARPRCRSPA
jgi:HAMP domain-containing protein